jgi:hypothetical protein
MARILPTDSSQPLAGPAIKDFAQGRASTSVPRIPPISHNPLTPTAVRAFVHSWQNQAN